MVLQMVRASAWAQLPLLAQADRFLRGGIGRRKISARGSVESRCSRPRATGSVKRLGPALPGLRISVLPLRSIRG